MGIKKDVPIYGYIPAVTCLIGVSVARAPTRVCVRVCVRDLSLL